VTFLWGSGAAYTNVASVGSIGSGSTGVTVSATVDRITMRPEHALSVGLITNELVTNAYKYAFTDGRIGHVDVRLAQANGKVELSVADNGVGCPEKPPCSAKTASS